ncbi:hypothetical protein DL768_008916 [Monosporascus sp. mg162]|nr:hypothetical protein DL768_008916 [Monosporascus sp. mg162]
MTSNLDSGDPTAATPPKASPVNAQEFGSQYCIPPLSAFLKHAGAYTEKQQRSHLRFVRNTVVPRIGPQPEPFVRFAFDPVGAEIGDGSTPLPKEALFSMLPGLVEATQADMHWFNQIKEGLFLKEEEVPVVRAQWSAIPRSRRSSSRYTFTAGTVKIYAQVKLNAFRTVEHAVTFGGKRRDDTTLRGLERLRKIWHVLLNEPRIAEDDDFAAASVDPDSRYKTLSYSWELRQGQELPDLKIYIHLWLHAKDNHVMLENWEKFFKANGWEWGAHDSYRTMIEDALFVSPFIYVLPSIAASFTNTAGSGKEYTTAETPVIHTCAFFQFTDKKGVYMTSYMSPPVPEC